MFNTEYAEAAIQKGERTRVLFDLLLSELGMTYDNSRGEVWSKLQEAQEEYNDAIQTLAAVIKDTKAQELTQEKEGVS